MQKIYSCFVRQGFWTRNDFRHFLNLLFSNKQRPYYMLSDTVDDYFRITDINQDEKIDFNEFVQAWKKIVKCVIKFKCSLISFIFISSFFTDCATN